MKVISFKKKKTINADLPNGSVFNAEEDDMPHLFERPLEYLSISDQEGLIMLALAIVYAEHRLKKPK